MRFLDETELFFVLSLIKCQFLPFHYLDLTAAVRTVNNVGLGLIEKIGHRDI